MKVYESNKVKVVHTCLALLGRERTHILLVVGVNMCLVATASMNTVASWPVGGSVMKINPLRSFLIMKYSLKTFPNRNSVNSQMLHRPTPYSSPSPAPLSKYSHVWLQKLKSQSPRF